MPQPLHLSRLPASVWPSGLFGDHEVSRHVPTAPPRPTPKSIEAGRDVRQLSRLLSRRLFTSQRRCRHSTDANSNSCGLLDVVQIAIMQIAAEPLIGAAAARLHPWHRRRCWRKYPLNRLRAGEGAGSAFSRVPRRTWRLHQNRPPSMLNVADVRGRCNLAKMGRPFCRLYLHANASSTASGNDRCSPPLRASGTAFPGREPSRARQADVARRPLATSASGNAPPPIAQFHSAKDEKFILPADRKDTMSLSSTTYRPHKRIFARPLSSERCPSCWWTITSTNARTSAACSKGSTATICVCRNARTGLGAIEILRRRSIRHVIIDNLLPDMDGLELVIGNRRHVRHTAVI